MSVAYLCSLNSKSRCNWVNVMLNECVRKVCHSMVKTVSISCTELIWCYVLSHWPAHSKHVRLRWSQEIRQAVEERRRYVVPETTMWSRRCSADKQWENDIDSYSRHEHSGCSVSPFLREAQPPVNFTVNQPKQDFYVDMQSFMYMYMYMYIQQPRRFR